MLKLITCHFNPQNYRRPVENYWRWRAHLGPLAEQLVTIELAFDDESFVIPDSIHIRGDRARHLMWQKEALINEAIRRLPPGVDKVAWLDHDLLFLKPDWYEQADRMLDEYPVGQLFSWIDFVDRDGVIDRKLKRPSWVECLRHPDCTHGPPGGAWAARRDVIERLRLPHEHLTGGGDQICVQSWTGRWDCYLYKIMNREWLQYSLRWGARAWQTLRGRIGLIPGSVVHLYHGERCNRSYESRTSLLSQYEFDPARDVEIDGQGLVTWASEKPAMHAAVAEYFPARREDG